MYRESEPFSIFTIYVLLVFSWENMILHADLNYFCKKGTNLSLFKGATDYTFFEVDIWSSRTNYIKYFWIPITSIESFVFQTTTNS